MINENYLLLGVYKPTKSNLSSRDSQSTKLIVCHHIITKDRAQN